MRKRSLLDRFLNKEVKQLVLCPVCGEYTSYSNHFVPRFFGNGDTLLNPTNPYWSIQCDHCKTNIKFSIKIVKENENV